MRRRLIAALALAVLAVAPASAGAAWFPAEPVDGPSADIVSVGEVAVAREGMAGVVYLRRDAGLPHVFVARLAGGAWEAPVRVDQGIAPPASQPVIAGANPDRLAVAWISNGSLFAAVRTLNAPGFGAPRLIAEGGVSNPSIDLSINGATYVSYTQNGDVKVARAARDSQDFAVITAPVDFDPAREAGTGPDARSRIAVSADGSAVVVWGERGADGRSHVFGRRIFEQRLSTAIEDLTLSEFEGRRATDADRPEIDVEDDSSFAQVAFRQMTDAGPRVIGRRLVGSQFDPPFAIDAGAPSTAGRIALTGRGEGVTAAQSVANQIHGGGIWNNKLERMQRWDSDPNGVAPRPIPLIGENEGGALAWFDGSSAADATVRAKRFDAVQTFAIEPEALLSNPALGPTDAEAGLAGGSTRVSDHVVAFVQGAGADRRLVVAVNDEPPARPLGQNTTNKRRLERFKWASARDLWGPIVYRVFVDGRQIAETQETELPWRAGLVSDGRHLWNVVAIDRRGQQTAGPRRVVRIENTPPVLRASIGRRGRTVSIRVTRFSDRGVGASGAHRIVVSFGNGRRVRIQRSVSYTYPRRGSYTLRVSGFDRAGNRTDITRDVRIG
ncbi:MAG TPA: hypothetical protein VGW75_07585 [Solirubrobacteraceae bacterium]|jgi:hypothetical protein|nr:hypothetical protein [Solirubrobacteraceae bacterium]